MPLQLREAEPEELITKTLEIYLEGNLQPEEVVTTTLAEAAVKKRVETYWSPRLASFATLGFENGGLIFRTDETPHELLPTSETDFCIDAVWFAERHRVFRRKR